MHKRFYICPMVRTFEDATDIKGRLEPLLWKYMHGVPSSRAEVGVIGNEGAPSAWALVKVNFSNDQDHVRIVSDIDVDALPDVAVDGIPPLDQGAEIQRMFTKYAVGGSVPTTMTMRTLLGRISRQAKPNFSQDVWF